MAKVVYKGKEVANNRNNYVDLLGKPTVNGKQIQSYNTSQSLNITWHGTQAQYDALPVKDSYTLYIITDVDGSTSKVAYENIEHKPAINGITLFNNTTYSDLDLMTRTEIESQLVGVFTYRGLVATMADLPNNPNAGDVYFVNSENSSFAYNGASWDNIGGSVDLSEYQRIEDNLLETDNKIIPAAINELHNEKQDKTDDNLETESKEVVGAINELNALPKVYSVDITAGKTQAAYAAIATDVFNKINDGYVIFASNTAGRHYTLERNTTDYLWFTSQYSQNQNAYQIWEEVIIGKTGSYQTKKYNGAPTAGNPNPCPITIIWGQADTSNITAGGVFKLFTVPWTVNWETYRINMTLSNAYPVNQTQYRPVNISLQCGCATDTTVAGGGSGGALTLPILTCQSGSNNTVLDAGGWGLIATTATDRKSFTVWGIHAVAGSSAYWTHGLTIHSIETRYNSLTADKIIIHNGKERFTTLGGYWDAVGFTRSNTNTSVLAAEKWKYPLPVERSSWYCSTWAAFWEKYNQVIGCGKVQLFMNQVANASGSVVYVNGLKNPTTNTVNCSGLVKIGTSYYTLYAVQIAETGPIAYYLNGSNYASLNISSPTAMSGVYIIIN